VTGGGSFGGAPQDAKTIRCGADFGAIELVGFVPEAEVGAEGAGEVSGIVACGMSDGSADDGALAGGGDAGGVDGGGAGATAPGAEGSAAGGTGAAEGRKPGVVLPGRFIPPVTGATSSGAKTGEDSKGIV